MLHIKTKLAARKDEHFDSTETALKDTINAASGNHDGDPKLHLHKPSDKADTHSFLSKYFPQSYLETIEANWHLGNFVFDRQTHEKTFEAMSIYVRLGMHLLYYGTAQEKALHWKRTLELLEEQSRKMGAEYDSPESKAHIWPFIKSFGLESTLDQLKEPDPDKYATFNEFFAREIRADARPIAEPENKLVVSSPADCRLTAFPTIDLAKQYWIKGAGFMIGRLLGDEDLAKKFEGGSIVIARLAPQDYHRWHSPINGKVQDVKEIPGAYFTVNPQAINEPGTLDVFCENKRSVMLLSRSETGSVIAIIAIGAMLVGSMKYVNGVDKPGSEVHRGQCLGAFYYGGSTVIVLFPMGEVQLDEDLVKNSMEDVTLENRTVEGCETLMRVGWRVGMGPVTDPGQLA